MAGKSPLFLPLPRAAVAFRPEFLDFERGIRVGNLEDNERITRLLKIGLENRFQQPFVTERWGRGIYWQWIGYLPRANRAAKPLSSHVSFGCAKYFVAVDVDKKLFQCGLQVERGYLQPPEEYPACALRPDWDWHRLVGALRSGGLMTEELKRLVMREGFRVFAGSWDGGAVSFSRSSPPDIARLRKALRDAPGNHWAGLQLYYPMRSQEVRKCTGIDLIESMLAVFGEVTPAMNLCMQIQLQPGSENG
jgi:hypothetical protein